jgi:hypothetical protein
VFTLLCNTLCQSPTPGDKLLYTIHVHACGTHTAAKCTLLTALSHNGILLFMMLLLCLCAGCIMRNICCKDFSNHRSCNIVQPVTRSGGWHGFVTRVILFENDVTRVSLFYFYTAVCTIDNVSLNVIRMLACTDISIPHYLFSERVGPLRRRKIHLSLYTFITKDYVRSTIHLVTLNTVS